jgi:hypothetical protein
MRRLLLLLFFAVWAGPATSATASPGMAPAIYSTLCMPEVHVEGAGLPADVVADFAESARALVAELRPRLGDEDCRPIIATLVGSMGEAPRLDPPWHLPTWAAGAARPAERRLVVGITAEGRLQARERTLHHELVHVLTHSAAGGAPLPRWLDEGLARVLAGEHGIDDLRVLAQARVADRFLPLSALADGFPAGSADAALAYAESGRAVSLLLEDEDNVARLLARVRAGDTVDDALRSVTGRATWQIDLDMRRSIGLWAALATVGLETDLAMAGCGVAVAVFGVRARRRQRARLAAMDDDDAPRRPPATATVSRWTVTRASC